MTAPAINGTRYPQPVDELLPAARKLAKDLGELPSRNRLMRTYRIGAPKADELRDRLAREQVRDALGLDQGALAATTVDQVADAFGVDGEQAERVHAVVTGAGDPWAYSTPIGPDPLPAPVVPESVPLVAPDPTPAPEVPAAEASSEVAPVGHPGTPTESQPRRALVVWPVILLALPAFVAIWSGWVGLGGLAGFGVVHPLPGIWDDFSINSAITLPIGVETYGAYASYVWLSGRASARLLTFAKWSAIASLLIGALGQVAYHLLVAAGVTSAPWQITTAVACLPVAVFGMGAGLAHLVREDGKR